MKIQTRLGPTTALALGLAASLYAQEPKRTTNPAGSNERTPGMAHVDTSRSSMPAYRSPSAAQSRAGKVPVSASDCGGDGWRTFRNPAFKSQKACENWVHNRDSQKNPPASAAPSRTPAR